MLSSKLYQMIWSFKGTLDRLMFNKFYSWDCAVNTYVEKYSVQTWLNFRLCFRDPLLLETMLILQFGNQRWSSSWMNIILFSLNTMYVLIFLYPISELILSMTLFVLNYNWNFKLLCGGFLLNFSYLTIAFRKSIC